MKVREEVEEADQYDYERSSLQFLKAFEWLSLDHYSSGESPGSVVRIPASYFPKSQPSKEDVDKNKRPLIHGTKKHTRATSAPRLHPQPLSSSPFPAPGSDDGSKTQTRRELLSPLKSHNSCHRHTRCKIFPGSGDSEIGPRQQQGHIKHSMESKKNVRVRGRTTPADDGQPQKKNHQH